MPHSVAVATAAAAHVHRPVAARREDDDAIAALVARFPSDPSCLASAPPHHLAALALRLPATLSPVLTMPHIADERYWRRACEEGRGWHVDIAYHGGSWKQAYAELFVADALRTFGVYTDQPPAWDVDMARPPLDARHPHWAIAHPGAPRSRLCGRPNRERFCANALDYPDLDERITISSDSGWPYLERLKGAVRVRTKACFNVASPLHRTAWAEGVVSDKDAHIAACKAAIELASKPRVTQPSPAAVLAAAALGGGVTSPPTSPAGKGKGSKAGAASPGLNSSAAPPSSTDVAAALLGVDPDVLMPSSMRVARDRRDAVLLAQAHDDVFDCAVSPLSLLGGTALTAGAWPLREWVSPSATAAWTVTTAWPVERGHSVLMLRARELRELLESIASCEDHVFCLRIAALPSHLDLELILSRLPNVARLDLVYGPLNRVIAPLPGYALPLVEEGVGAEGDMPVDAVEASTASNTTITVDGIPALLAPPDAVVFGLVPHDMASLSRCLRSSECILNTLCLSRNAIDDALAAALSAALAGNATVTSLDVSHNRIGPGGAEALARLFTTGTAGKAGVHASHSVITRLDVSYNEVEGLRGGAALASILRACPTLVHAAFALNPLGDEGGAAVLAAAAGHASLETLTLAGCRLGVGAAAAAAAAVLAPRGGAGAVGGAGAAAGAGSGAGASASRAGATALTELHLSANEAAWGGGSGGAGAGAAAPLDALTAAIVDASARGVGAARLRVCDVRPAVAPAALTEALRANKLTGATPLLGVYAAVIGVHAAAARRDI